MCGRYTVFTEDEIIEIREIIKDISIRIANEELAVLGKDAYPNAQVPVITKDKELKLMQWGFRKWDEDKVIFNARSETATQSKFFSQHIKTSRCIIPASSYYEWMKTPDKKSVKYRIKSQDDKLLFIAGFVRYDKEFTMLTRSAADNIGFIHSRMPFILQENMVSSWLNDTFDESILLSNSIPLKFEEVI